MQESNIREWGKDVAGVTLDGRKIIYVLTYAGRRVHMSKEVYERIQRGEYTYRVEGTSITVYDCGGREMDVIRNEWKR